MRIDETQKMINDYFGVVGSAVRTFAMGRRLAPQQVRGYRPIMMIRGSLMPRALG